ncbi:MAG: AhpC/TSA family, partial [Verrucomicrobiales bacterium]|nr:AhpC/TSA family [Verrucomicrobiales bacterium]
MVHTAISMKTTFPLLMALTAGLGILRSASAAEAVASPSSPAPVTVVPISNSAKSTKSGTPAATLKDANGKAVDPLADHGQKATLLFFLTTECSIGNGYAPEIARIADEFRQAGIVCYAVYAHEAAADV